MKMLRTLLLLVATFWLIASCSKDKKEKEIEDLHDPVIELYAPLESAYFNSGTHVRFSGEVSDDVALKELVVTLEYYGYTISSKSQLKELPYTWLPEPYVIQLEGIRNVFTDEELFNEVVPDIGSGYYELTFKVIDMSGKHSQEKVIIQL